MSINPTQDDMEDEEMRRNIFILLVAGLCLGLVPAAAFAEGPEGPEYYDSLNSISSGVSGGISNMTEADLWPASGPVETGAVPSDGSIIKDPSSLPVDPSSTHFDSFNPDRRLMEVGGGG